MKAKDEAEVRRLVDVVNQCAISNAPMPTPDQVVAALDDVEAGRDIDDGLAFFIAAIADTAERIGYPWRIKSAEVVRERMRTRMNFRTINAADGRH